MKKHISDFSDIHKNVPGIVLGAGPSLVNIPSCIADKYITIAVNSAINKFNNSKYFISDDSSICNYDYYRNMLNYSSHFFLYNEKFKNQENDFLNKNYSLFSHKIWFDMSKKEFNEEGIKLTKEEPIIGTFTSAGSAVHLLYIMGCNPIFVAGCDCGENNNIRYYHEIETQYKIKQISNYHNIYFNQLVLNKSYKDFSFFWQKLKESIDKNNTDINIIFIENNNMKSFKTITIKELLERY